MSRTSETVRAAVDTLADALEVDPDEDTRRRLTRHVEETLTRGPRARAKLTKTQRALIREEYAHGGGSYRTLARKYGVNASTILRVIRGTGS